MYEFQFNRNSMKNHHTQNWFGSKSDNLRSCITKQKQKTLNYTILRSYSSWFMFRLIFFYITSSKSVTTTFKNSLTFNITHFLKKHLIKVKYKRFFFSYEAMEMIKNVQKTKIILIFLNYKHLSLVKIIKVLDFLLKKNCYIFCLKKKKIII